MKTEDLIAVLAAGAGPAPRAVAARRLLPVALLGAGLSALASVVWFGLVPSPMFAAPALWLKLGYAGMLALAASWLVARLARPVSRLGGPWRAVLAVLAVMALLGITAWLAAAPGDRVALMLGQTWRSCPWNVFALSLPTLAAALWALRSLAPTRLRAAGAAAGLFAGALGALGYALACTELSTAFVATWYTLGIALSTALGAALGPRVLRW